MTPTITNRAHRRIFRFVIAPLSLLLVSAAIGFVSGLVAPRQTHALPPNPMTPNDFPFSLRSQITNYDNSCSTNPNKYMLLGWISWGSDYRADSIITVPYGTTSVPLKFNSAVFLCKDLVNINGTTYPNLPNDGTPKSTVKLSANYSYVANTTLSCSAAPCGSLQPNPNAAGRPGPTGYTLTIGYNSGTRYWMGGGGLDFSWDAGGPLTSSKTIYITVSLQSVNRFGSSYVCGANGAVVSGPPPNSCPLTSVTYTLLINVPPPPRPPAVNISSLNCTTISGSATDPDNGAILRVRIVDSNGVVAYDGNTDGAHNYSVNISSFRDFASRTFSVTAYGVNSGGAPDGLNATATSGSVGPCATAACTSITSSPAIPQPGQSFSMTVNFNAPIGSRGKPATYTASFSTSPGGLYGGPNPFKTAGLSPGGSAYNAQTPNMTAPGSQQYTGTFTVVINGSYTYNWTFGPAGNCGAALAIANQPYFRVYGGNVTAGTTNACPGWTSGSTTGTIIGWNDGTGKGAAGQLAALANGLIDQFTTATLRTSPGPSHGLTFANTTSPIYGGGLASLPCPYDYFGNQRPGIAGTSPFGINTGLANNTYKFSGPTTITGGTLNFGVKLTLYVDGDVYIGSNVTYPSNGGWNDLSKVPSLYVVARGNIYVDSNVTQLDGVFVAQPDTAGGRGTIYSCATGSVGAPAVGAATVYTSCQSRLVVNGAFVGRTIKLLRSNGTMLNSSVTEPNTSGNIAEVFNEGPELWVTTPAPFSNNKVSPIWDAATVLPPIL